MTPKKSGPPDKVDELLELWSRTVPTAPHTHAPEVWRRIKKADRPRTILSWVDQINLAFARPSFAGAFVVACMLLGLFLAEARSSRLQAAYGAQLAQKYLSLIDPLLNEADTTSTSKS